MFPSINLEYPHDKVPTKRKLFNQTWNILSVNRERTCIQVSRWNEDLNESSVESKSFQHFQCILLPACLNLKPKDSDYGLSNILANFTFSPSLSWSLPGEIKEQLIDIECSPSDQLRFQSDDLAKYWTQCLPNASPMLRQMLHQCTGAHFIS
jgi:hypothetical protein